MHLYENSTQYLGISKISQLQISYMLFPQKGDTPRRTLRRLQKWKNSQSSNTYQAKEAQKEWGPHPWSWVQVPAHLPWVAPSHVAMTHSKKTHWFTKIKLGGSISSIISSLCLQCPIWSGQRFALISRGKVMDSKGREAGAQGTIICSWFCSHS